MNDLTPQQKAFLKCYFDPKSETWSNGYQSALRAGYTEQYAKVITTKDLEWLSENVSDTLIVQKAEKNLVEALDGGMDATDGPKQIKYKATEFSLKALRKEKYSERKELTGPNGERLFTPSKEEEDRINKALESFNG